MRKSKQSALWHLVSTHLLVHSTSSFNVCNVYAKKDKHVRHGHTQGMWSKEEGQLDRKPWALNKHVPHRCSKLPNGLDSPWVYHRMESFASAAQHYWQMSLQEMQPMLVLEAWVSSRQQHPKSFHTERISNTGTSSILQRNKKIVNIST